MDILYTSPQNHLGFQRRAGSRLRVDQQHVHRWRRLHGTEAGCAPRWPATEYVPCPCFCSAYTEATGVHGTRMRELVSDGANWICTYLLRNRTEAVIARKQHVCLDTCFAHHGM